ncbi:MAG: SBBP repeat-containing protein [Pyrinomonadaceae bacterium]
MNRKLSLIYSLLTLSVLFCAFFYLVSPTHVLSENSKKTEKLKGAFVLPESNESIGKVPVCFERNDGQFDKRVKYFARGTAGYSLFLTANEAVFVLEEGEKARSRKSEDDFLGGKQRTKPGEEKAIAVFMKLAGAGENVISAGSEKLPHKTNYFKGEKSDWRTDIPNFKQVRMEDVYQGIDTVWKGRENGSIQYDFIVEPNADPNQIEWRIEGAKAISINENGDLLIETEFGTIKQEKPFTFQENSEGLRREVESRFIVRSENKIGFEIGIYDRTKTLTIDPSVNLTALAFSTFLGGSSVEEGDDIAVDRAGNVYVTGYTDSPSFPTTPGTFDTSRNGGEDVFVTKLNAGGTELVYSTFIGGASDERGFGIAVDDTGNAFVTGRTFDSTTDYPTTVGAFDVTHNGNYDVFVTKLDMSGSALVYSTFVGGTSNDFAEEIAVDTNGNAYIAGSSASGNFPTTSGAYDTSLAGSFDAVLTKLSPDGASLVYSTFIGGGGTDFANGVAIDASGNAFITGSTDNSITPFPTTPTAFDTVPNGLNDVFVTRFNAGGSGLLYSTLIGGSLDDIGLAIAVDSGNNAYITGYTNDGTTDYPTTSGAFDTTHNGIADAFVTKVDTRGENLLYSTFVGGNDLERGYDIKVDALGNAFITGFTNDSSAIDYPVTANAFDATHNGSSDVFVTKLNQSGAFLLYSTFLGGNSSDLAYALDIDSSGNIFITGETFSGLNYPTTPDVIQRFPDSGGESFVSKLGDFSIAGRTVDYDGNPLANVAVALSGASSGFVFSDADGFYGFSDTAAGNFAVSATLPLYQFNPPAFQFPALATSQNLTFVGLPTTGGPTAAPADLGGKVSSAVGNIGLPNTRLTLIGTGLGDVSVTTTDAFGNYEFEGVTTGAFYLIFAEKEGYDFAPQIYEINHFEDNLNLDFEATPNSPRPVDDFDGDGKTDFTVFRPENGIWYILNSQDNSVRTERFGLEGDIPVAADYDGDARTDIAVYRPADGNWYRLNSTDGGFHAIHFGTLEDVPVPADFDGDGKADPAVYRPATGVWHRLLSENGGYQSIRFGISTDEPVAADYDADGKADLTVYRKGIWYRLRSSDGQIEILQFGTEGDRPQKADFDGDGRIDTALYRPSDGVWYWLKSSDGDFAARQFGTATDVPVAADYNGDGRYEQAVFRNGTWFVLRNDNSFYWGRFGQNGDVPIPNR